MFSPQLANKTSVIIARPIHLGWEGALTFGRLNISISIILFAIFLFGACTKAPQGNGMGFGGRQTNTFITSPNKVRIDKSGATDLIISGSAGAVAYHGVAVDSVIVSAWNISNDTLHMLQTSANPSEIIDGEFLGKTMLIADGSFSFTVSTSRKLENVLVAVSDTGNPSVLDIPASKGSDQTTAVYSTVVDDVPAAPKTVFPEILSVVLPTPTPPINNGGGSPPPSGLGGIPLTPPAVNWTGTKQLGVAGSYIQSRSTKTDSSGNVYIVGATGGSLDGNTLTGTTDLVLAKYSVSGVRLWSRQVGATGRATEGMAVAVDFQNNVIAAGYTNGSADGGVLMGSRDFILVKFNEAGVKQWTRQLGVASKMTYGSAVVTDSTGNIFVGGYTEGALDGNIMTGLNDRVITKYSPNGTKQWTRQSGAAIASAPTGPATTVIESLAIDPSGNIFAGGYTNGNLDGNIRLGPSDSFVTKFNSSGVVQWTKQMGIANRVTSGASIAVDASGNTFIAGTTSGGLSGNSLTGIHDVFLVKYNSSGVAQWTRQLGASSKRTYGTSVALDTGGNAFVTGYTEGALDGNSLSGAWDAFVLQYDSSGLKQWSTQFGAAPGTFTNAYSITVGLGDVPFVLGTTSGDLSGNGLTGTQDAFISKIDLGFEL